jgi:ribonuclease D
MTSLQDTPPAGNKPVHYINNAAGLETCIQQLAVQEVLAFDLEFDNHRYSYGVTLCLIQVATPDACYVIDPFGSLNLEGLYRVFEDDRIQKIVHAPGEDLRLLHSLKCYPKNLFDTEIPARLLDYEQTSIAVLLQQKLGITLNKQQQKSNWLQRPLADQQIRYAADDVAFLHQLKAALLEELAGTELMSFMLEEQDALSTIIYEQEKKDSFLKPADLHSLSPREQYILNALFAYRDDLAQKSNKPAYRVMNEALLRELAAGLATEKDIYRIFKNPRFAEKIAVRLRAIQAEATALHLSESKPRREWLSPAEQAIRENANRDKTGKFLPIQQALAERFGTFAARFLLSGNTVNEVLMRNITIGGLRCTYRQNLVRNTAADLGIDINSYN